MGIDMKDGTNSEAFDALDDRLRQRRFESANPDLAYAIISAARTVPQVSSQGFMAWMGMVLTDLFPRPAYVLATALIMGILSGMAFPAQLSNDEYATEFGGDEEGTAL